MRAILFEAPGKIRLIDDAPKPVPQDGELLGRCTHIGLCGSSMDLYLGQGRWAKTNWPAIPGWMGHENLGIVAESPYEELPPGTPVLAHPEVYAGFADFITSRPEGTVALPQVADPISLVVAQPLATVLRALSYLPPVMNLRCVVLGQGPLGLIFTNLLAHMGAAQVIGMDPVRWRLDWSRRMGATDAVDASAENVVDAVKELTSGRVVDLAIEAVGSPESLNTSAYLPRCGGRLCVFGMPRDDLEGFPWFHATGNDVQITTCRSGDRATAFFPVAVRMVVERQTEVADLVTPRMPWERALQAFDMYANPARHEGALRITLEL